MNAHLLSKLDYPYGEMLQSLKDVKGYDEFIKFIGPRVRKNDDWKAEVCALFEINKTRHPLIEICSQQSSTPEGIFKVSGGLGIIEAAKIGYLFDTNNENRKRINKIVNCFKPLANLLTGQYSAHNVRIEVYNTDKIISDSELEDARNAIAVSLRQKKTPLISVITGFGRIAIRKGEAIDVTAADIDLLIGINDKGGIVTQTYNVDLNKKIGRVLKFKRGQHKAKYDDYVKLYYFFVDCPAPRLLEVDLNRIFNQLDDREMVYMSTVFGSNREGRTRLMRSGIIISGKGLDPKHFDLSNKYFQGCPFPDPKHIKRIL
jgi:hypothetical protein